MVRENSSILLAVSAILIVGAAAPTFGDDSGVHLRFPSNPGNTSTNSTGSSNASQGTNTFGSNGSGAASTVNSSSARPGGNEIAGFSERCRNLPAAICNGSGDLIRDRESRGQSLGGRLLRSFTGNNPGVRQLFDLALRTASRGFLNNNRLFGLYSGYLNFLNGWVQRNAPLDDCIPGLKDALLKSIDEQGYNGDAAKKMKEIANNLSVSAIPDLQDPRSVAGYSEACGFGGLAPGAFSVEEKRQVIVCPGMLIRAIATAEAQGQNPKAAFCSAIAHVVPHEFFHQFGADVNRDRNGRLFAGPFFKVHQERVACLFKDFPAARLFRDPRTGQTIDEGAGRAGETEADAGSDDTLRTALRDGRSAEDHFKTVKNALLGLCDSQGDPEHPDGFTRIRIASRSLGEALNCPDTPPQCGLGDQTGKFFASDFDTGAGTGGQSPAEQILTGGIGTNNPANAAAFNNGQLNAGVGAGSLDALLAGDVAGGFGGGLGGFGNGGFANNGTFNLGNGVTQTNNNPFGFNNGLFNSGFNNGLNTGFNNGFNQGGFNPFLFNNGSFNNRVLLGRGRFVRGQPFVFRRGVSLGGFNTPISSGLTTGVIDPSGLTFNQLGGFNTGTNVFGNLGTGGFGNAGVYGLGGIGGIGGLTGYGNFGTRFGLNGF